MHDLSGGLVNTAVHPSRARGAGPGCRNVGRSSRTTATARRDVMQFVEQTGRVIE